VTSAGRVGLTSLVLTTLVLLPGVCGAQPDPPALVTDRPSFTSAARVVGTRTIQVESGVSVTRDRLETDAIGPIEFTTLELPNALVRVGLTRRLELRAAMIGWIRTTIDRAFAEPASVLSTVDLAAEYQVAAQEGIGADLAVIAGVSVSTQDFAAGDHTIDPFAQFMWSRDLTGSVNVGGMFAWSLPSSAGHRLETFSGSVVFGHPLGGRWSAFWEAVGGNQDTEDAKLAWTGNFGVQLAVGDDVQFDAFVGRGLNEPAAGWAVGAGASDRFRR
jgi:hypothetical protein